MKDEQFDKILEFTKLLHAFQRTDRAVRVPGTDRLENDAEHSYLLAVLAWYLIDALDLKLDKEKVFKYALAHDIVEIYAGDTPAFGKGGGNKGDIRSTKKQREAESFKKIRADFPRFASFTGAMEAYDAQSDEESRFVYALDKLVPILGGYAQDGRDWHEYDISFDDVLNYKLEKIQANKDVYAVFQKLMALLEKDKKRYFN